MRNVCLNLQQETTHKLAVLDTFWVVGVLVSFFLLEQRDLFFSYLKKLKKQNNSFVSLNTYRKKLLSEGTFSR